MVLQTKVYINNVIVTSLMIDYEIEFTYGDSLPEAVLRFVRDVDTLVTLTVGQPVKIYRGYSAPDELLVFQGYVEKVDPEGGKVTVTAIDKLWDLVRKEVTHVYIDTVDSSAGKISEIFKDLVTTYGGLTADATSIQDSGTTFLLQKLVCNHTDIFERCAVLSSALDWQFYYRADTDKVYFEPKGFTTNANTLTVGGNVISVPKWQNDITDMVNDITVVGATSLVETTKSGQIFVTSGFYDTDILLDYQPETVKVYGDASNPPTTLKTGGVVNSTAVYDFYVDKDAKKIYPKPGTTFTNYDYYEIRYNLITPIDINMYDQYSIDTYGHFKKTVTYKDIRNMADAEQRGTNYLSRFSIPFIYSTLKVKNSSDLSLRVGQKILVVDSVNSPSINRTLLINKLRMRWPGDYDELDVGDKIWRLAGFNADVVGNLKRIMEDQLSNYDMVTNLVNFDNTINNPFTINNRYFKVLTQTASGTNLFILGNASFGVLGTYGLGDSGLGAETDYFISQYLNSYEETFYDEDFKAAATTANWNTAGLNLIMTAAQIGQSTSIDYNNGTLTTATMTVTITSGTYTLYLSADGGSHWETATNGSPLTFVNTGTDLRWKILCNTGGTITKVAVTVYH